MRWNRIVATGGLVFMALVAISRLAAAMAPQAGPMAAAAAASPGLVGELSTALGSTKDQAAGAAGVLFGLAKSRLAPAQFGQVAKAVPGMDALLKAAPSAGAGASGALSQLGGSAGSLAAAASAFSKLGLSPSLASKAASVITSFVTKSGGADVGKLLSGALK